MVQLIRKGGLRERANRSRSYQGSENTEATLKPNRYSSSQKTDEKKEETTVSPILVDQDLSRQD
ncbi:MULTISPECIES: hypothetical protein [Acinetobacter]|jgi:hypothetical protein|uniref:Uncharacterized protein n=2 Tax=Acinetobacter schindleri TaxID=108981 RepID=N8Z716_9GAMM|nr:MULTISPECIES: hypothetical protein [Acinetobacter]APX63153.1 hypothetical protein AsACE_CH01757 [Acinetobacter schindleri]EIM39738.1 hypothetical protein HADU_04525 [Acinetobacter sp. HA]ENV44711.1 hypothetical protein F955_01504 [Acinetobacter schindleri CIP 107287]MBB4834786.1 hypothetical protein [Acinetobacter schindleri]POU16114.1 hypothetical protein C3420_15865 [Acinetobacter sp. ACNIH3]